MSDAQIFKEINKQKPGIAELWEREEALTEEERRERCSVPEKLIVKPGQIPPWEVYAHQNYCQAPEKPAFPSNQVLNGKIALWQGNITHLQVDAVQNAANTSLLGGGGIDGAIHKAAGRQLVQETMQLDGCETGQTKISRAYKMPSKYVLHTVGPIGEHPSLLKSCYKTTLQLSIDYNIRTIALCGVSTGVYGYPVDKAAEVAVKTVRKWLDNPENAEKVDLIIFVVFLDRELSVYRRVLAKYFPVENVIQPQIPAKKTEGIPPPPPVGVSARTFPNKAAQQIAQLPVNLDSSPEAIRQKLQILTRGLDYLFADDAELPPHPGLDASVPHSPVRTGKLSNDDKFLAIANALRYFPKKFHEILAKEFAEELKQYNHVYMYRFRPTEYEMCAYPISYYPAQSKQAAAVMLMIQNNLDRRVAQYPHELITYGGNGSVFQNWAQYLLVMKYLSEMNENQTLSMYSGHPMGLFPSHPNAPRVVITNGMVIPNYSSKADYDRFHALGVTMYGQMTAGSYCYIGPQGIVHGTTITILNAGRKYLGTSDLRGKVFVTSGLGGMSGAQPKAATICGIISVTAEICESHLDKRLAQGWVAEKITSLESCISRIQQARESKEVVSIAFLGNIVTLWEALADHYDRTGELLVELGSDQTSLHNPYNGGYYPVQLSYQEANQMMVNEPERFKELVQESLVRQINAINQLTKNGLHFWDYGNSFLLEASRAKADVVDEKGKFIYPSYVEHIIGDIFSLGFGPFRWVCTSGLESDLDATDAIATEIVDGMIADAPPKVKAQLEDNLLWIKQAKANKLVVGSQARILYADSQGRNAIAQAFNQAIAEGKISAPIVLSRDHHDVSGADSPYRETSNIRDGSSFTADMAVQNCIGDAMRGATWVALHNGGGVGWGEVINGGFGLVLDGSERASNAARSMLFWDVNNGISRRAWARNENALDSIKLAMEREPLLKVTLPELADDSVVTQALF